MTPYPPVESYALLSDCHSAALVSREGSIDWASFHRFDAPSTFGRLLDWERGGFCSLAPVGSEPAGRRYAGPTMVLETDHRADGSMGRTIDFLAVSYTSRAATAEHVHPYHQLIRVADGVSGSMEWEFVCRPRFEYGIVHPRATLLTDSSALLAGGPEALSILSPVPLEAAEGEVRARFRLGEGERAWFAVTRHEAHDVHLPSLDAHEVNHRYVFTAGYWEEWAAACSYRGPHADDVLRSALTLKALTNAPTGAIVAAATTSLPEDPGGVRNWDYRYCWLRDSAFTLYALHILGYASEARSFVEWLVRTTAGRAQDLQVLYGVGGERFLPEVTLDHLEGYRRSQPVRAGNGATTQFQLDLYGEVVDTVHLWRKAGGECSPDLWAFLRDCVDQVRRRWREPDEGIWEVRAGRRHFVHSKVMCWVAVDRALKIAAGAGLEAPAAEWRALAAEIREDVLTRGFDPEVGAFVRSYGSKDLDASALLLPLVGFVRPDDPRMVSTVDAVASRLAPDGLVYRYLAEDGLPGGEGAFLICSFWLVDNLALQGRVAEAEALFTRISALRNDVGLFAEEVDPATGAHLGNFPQAFTHVALVNAAHHLAPPGP